jgi:3-phenylpropionate/trans-cinnamate dioxygenase ferredoxin reductase subunit
MAPTFVIVGASLAGGSAAVTLREEGFDGRVILIGEETHLPYERPPLSKEYLRGERPFSNALVQPPEFYPAQHVETRLGVRATQIHPAARIVELAGGKRVPYDKVLIATGSRNRRLPVPGLQLEGVHGLRTIEEADRIRAEIAPGRKAVMVGMGFIGCEVAASLRRCGVAVTAVAPGRVPLERVLGTEVGTVLEGIHRDHGVEMVFDDSVAAFEGGDRVERVMTRKGRAIACDFAVVGVGIEPVTELAAGSGVEVENGIVVDQYCRTNVDGVYAAGDVTNHYHPVFGQRMRVEHWQNARRQGASAARNMLGKAEPYDEIHWFWSDQYDVNLQYTGFHQRWDDLVVRGSLEERDFVAFYLQGGLLVAAVGVNRGKEIRRSMPLIRARSVLEASALRDESVDLRKLASPATGVGSD